MHQSARRHLLSLWIALLCVLFGALAPALSHAMAASAAPGEEVQICTMDGMKTIVVDAAPSGTPQAPVADHMLQHCPYCAMHAGDAWQPPAPPFLFPAAVAAGTHPPLFYRSPAPLFAWTAANPRAPPVVS